MNFLFNQNQSHLIPAKQQLKKQSANQKLKSYQNCWVCEGWSEKKFQWKPQISGESIKEPIYIHFDFDEYRPWLMEKVK